ncbi:hypothetical protein COLO4_04321 [Corchorus olitorius]|uniref:RNase H type-1 domain-containing protein n=1 Tax=Corchorus olitorius TaxID=93759 RepID=A0A1R3KUK9_9ROSI|nr:hypothetical protein COLO4_04321 [Corchorus olitorius]
MEHKDISVNKAIQWIQNVVSEFVSIWRRQGKAVPKPLKPHCGLERPKQGWNKVNCDGAYCSKSSQAGKGIILRDHHGGFIAGSGKKVLGDSALIIKALAVKEGMNLPFSYILIVLRTCFSNVDFKCVRREANMAADWLVVQSRLGMRFADISRYQPSSLVRILNKDSLPAPHEPDL